MVWIRLTDATFRVPGRTASGVDSGVPRTRTGPSIRECRHVTIYLPNPDVGPIGSEPGEFIDPSAAEGRDTVPATRKSVGTGNPAAVLAADPELVPQGTADTAAERQKLDLRRPTRAGKEES
jgi:hypothetical protein